MYTSVIFDLDGTLLDTVADLADATNKVLERNGFIALPEDNYNHYLGDGIYNLMIRVLDAQPENIRPERSAYAEISETLVSEQKSTYSSLWREKTKLYPNIDTLIAKLKDAGAKLGVVTNKPHAFAVLMIEHFFGNDTFDIIVGQQDGIPVKPAPDSLLSVMDVLKVNREQILYVGDTNTDMQTAKNADVTSIGVTWGFRSEAELIAHDAQFIVHNALEIYDLYCK